MARMQQVKASPSPQRTYEAARVVAACARDGRWAARTPPEAEATTAGTTGRRSAAVVCWSWGLCLWRLAREREGREEERVR